MHHLAGMTSATKITFTYFRAPSSPSTWKKGASRFTMAVKSTKPQDDVQELTSKNRHQRKRPESEKKERKPVTVRKNLPETWLWKEKVKK